MYSNTNQPLYIWFIDVGMGDATFILFPNGKTALVDFGSTKVSSIIDDVLKFFDNIGEIKDITQKKTLKEISDYKEFFTNKTIDFLFITHPDTDHYNLVTRLTENMKFTFNNVYYTGNLNDYKNNFDQWLTNQVKVGVAKLLDTPNGLKMNADFGGVDLYVLIANFAVNTSRLISNSRSIVLMLKYGSQKVILAGDATYLTESQILNNIKDWHDQPGSIMSQELDIQGAILKLGHHGSARTSTSKEWVEAVKPIALFISAERTGTQTGSDGSKTGHRLPQVAAIDTVLQFSPKSLQEFKDIYFSYIGYYDKKDENSCFGKSRSFQHFNQTNSNSQDILDYHTFKKDDTTQPDNYYYEIKTNKAIFTTICKLDYPVTTTSPAKLADLGTTYGLVIDSQGGWNVFPWLNDFYSFNHWHTDEAQKGFHLGIEIK